VADSLEAQYQSVNDPRKSGGNENFIDEMRAYEYVSTSDNNEPVCGPIDHQVSQTEQDCRPELYNVQCPETPTKASYNFSIGSV